MTRSPPNTRSPFARRTVSWSDEDLIEACLAGDQAAWEELVDRYGRLVYSIPRRYGLSEADADDVVQEVFTILYQKLDTIRDRSRLSAWLVSTTHRESLRTGKQSGRYVMLEQTVADEDAPAEEQAAAWERQQAVRQALRRLGGRCEQLLVALFSGVDRPDYEAIAEQLGMKIGSIGPTRARCFKKLEKFLADAGLEELVRRTSDQRLRVVQPDTTDGDRERKAAPRG